MSKIYEYFEPFSEERATIAKKMAERIFKGDYENYDEATMVLIWIISRHYGIPFFSEYFKERTLEDLVFESELIRLQSTPLDQQKSAIVKDNIAEADALFPDEWEDTEVNPQIDDSVIDNITKDFFETGKFKDEP